MKRGLSGYKLQNLKAGESLKQKNSHAIMQGFADHGEARHRVER
jgi:hypothetical protein